MFRYFIYVILVFSLSSCSVSSKNVSEQNNEKATKEYLKNLKEVENYYNKKYVGNIPTSEIKFLQTLTGINSYSIKSFEEIFEPSKDNIDAWKNWYDKNKQKLYWDEKDNKVKLLNN